MTGEMPRAAKEGRYTTMQACGLLGVSKSTLLRAVNAGEIRYGTGGNGRRVYRGEELIRFWCVRTGYMRSYGRR